jgi:hypothetical protein
MRKEKGKRKGKSKRTSENERLADALYSELKRGLNNL